jgi:hypothetical protein
MSRKMIDQKLFMHFIEQNRVHLCQQFDLNGFVAIYDREKKLILMEQNSVCPLRVGFFQICIYRILEKFFPVSRRGM